MFHDKVCFPKESAIPTFYSKGEWIMVEQGTKKFYQ